MVLEHAKAEARLSKNSFNLNKSSQASPNSSPVLPTTVNNKN